MEIKTIDAVAFQKMFLAGAKGLAAEKDYINELNVFPVPDGDTGTNMTMTIMSAAKEVAALENPDMKTLAKAISSGSLPSGLSLDSETGVISGTPTTVDSYSATIKAISHANYKTYAKYSQDFFQ